MSAWIGPMGNLIEFKCPSAVESGSDDAHVYFRPLGGSVATTVLGDPTRPRVWDVKVSAARPDHVVSLDGVASGEWGPGPFVFIPPAAPTLNLLGKREALAMAPPGAGYVNDTPGVAPAVTTEGVAGTGYVATGSGTPSWASFGTAPVIPGQIVTGKVWAHARPDVTAILQLKFYNSGGAELALSPFASTTSTTGEFLAVTMVAPPSAASVKLAVRAAYLTRPSVTWTDSPRPWAPSAASSNIVMSGLSNSVRRATGVAGEEQITDHAFTVQELTA